MLWETSINEVANSEPSNPVFDASEIWEQSSQTDDRGPKMLGPDVKPEQSRLNQETQTALVNALERQSADAAFHHNWDKAYDSMTAAIGVYGNTARPDLIRSLNMCVRAGFLAERQSREVPEGALRNTWLTRSEILYSTVFSELEKMPRDLVRDDLARVGRFLYGVQGNLGKFSEASVTTNKLVQALRELEDKNPTSRGVKSRLDVEEIYLRELLDTHGNRMPRDTRASIQWCADEIKRRANAMQSRIDAERQP